MFVYQMKRFCCLSILLLVSTTLGEEVDPYYVSGEVLVFKQILPEGYINSSLHKDEIDYSPHGPAFPFGINHLPSGPAPPSQDLPPTHRPKPGGNSPPSRPISPSTNDINHPPSDPNGPSPIPAVLFYPTPSGVISPPEDTSKHPPENVPDRPPSEATTNSPLQVPGCTILLPDPIETPLLLYGDQPFYPGEEVAVNEGDTVYFVCPGGILMLGIDQTSISATCFKNNFYYNQNKLDPEKLICNAQPQHSARYTGGKCDRNGKEIEIGYEFTPNFFHRLILVCFDDDLKMALYSQYNITGNFTNSRLNPTSSVFRETGFYNLSKPVSEIYSLENQRKAINNQIGLPEYSREYIQDGKYHITEGQLTSRRDFVHPTQQEATLNFVNVVPLWGIINSGNWRDSEICTRIAAKRKGGLMIYTGIQEVAVLRHKKTGIWTELYLYNEDRKAIPVPRLLWRVLYHPETKAGIAIVTFNNPYEFHHFTYCKDISRYIGWLDWDAPRDNRYGDSYACDIDDLRDYIKRIPYLKVRRLLV